jgi:hypothetical protein
VPAGLNECEPRGSDMSRRKVQHSRRDELHQLQCRLRVSRWLHDRQPRGGAVPSWAVRAVRCGVVHKLQRRVHVSCGVDDSEPGCCNLPCWQVLIVGRDIVHQLRGRLLVPSWIDATGYAFDDARSRSSLVSELTPLRLLPRCHLPLVFVRCTCHVVAITLSPLAVPVTSRACVRAVVSRSSDGDVCCWDVQRGRSDVLHCL